MNYPAAPRLPTIPLPRVDARRRASAFPYGSNVPVAPPSVHEVLGVGLIYDTSIASSSRLEAFTTAGRPLTHAILDAPAMDRHQNTAAVTFPTLRACILVRSAGGQRFITVRDVVDAIDGALQLPMPCAHDRVHGCPTCSMRRADFFGTRFLRVHVQSTSVGDYCVSVFAQTP